MNTDLVLYDPERAGLTLPSRELRTQGEARGSLSDPTTMLPPARHLSDEVREQIDAYLTAASERDPARAEFMDLMTASLGALQIQQELAAIEVARERIDDYWIG